MKGFYKGSKRKDKKIYNINQIEEYFNRVEGIKKEINTSYKYNNLTLF